MARYFDGNAANYLTVGAQTHGNFPTVCAWVKLDDDTGTHSIFGYYNGGFTGDYIHLRIENGKVAYSVNVPPSQTAIGATTIPPGEWHHVLGSYDGLSRVYLDGVLDGSGGGSNFSANFGGGTQKIGYVDGGSPFKGYLAEVAHFSTSIFDEEIAALAAGMSPSRIQHDLLNHVPLFGVESPELDYQTGVPCPITGTVPAGDHPPFIGSPWGIG